MRVKFIVMATAEAKARRVGLKLGEIMSPDVVEMNGVPRVGDSVELATEWPDPFNVLSVIWTPGSMEADAVVILEDG